MYLAPHCRAVYKGEENISKADGSKLTISSPAQSSPASWSHEKRLYQQNCCADKCNQTHFMVIRFSLARSTPQASSQASQAWMQAHIDPFLIRSCVSASDRRSGPRLPLLASGQRLKCPAQGRPKEGTLL